MGGERRFQRLFRSGVHEQETREELAFHRECTIEELMAAGRSREEAEDEAAKRFGDQRSYERALARLETRREWRERAAHLVGMLGYALRRLRRSPGMAAAVIATFAIGIGANATMFGIVDRILLSPPQHVVEHESVKRINVRRYLEWLGTHSTGEIIAYPDYQDLHAARSFSDVAAYVARDMTVGRGEESRPVRALLATPELFPLLGTRPFAGRFIHPEENVIGAEGVVVLGHGFWREHFGGDLEVIGKTIDLGYGLLTVVGIAPPGFTGVDLERIDLIVPLVSTVAATDGTTPLESRDWHWLSVVGRVAANVSPAVASEEATTLHRSGRSEEIGTGAYDQGAQVVLTDIIAARGEDAGSEVAVARWLTAISLIVLLIACANIANLLLARSIRQQRETAIRLALGGSRRHVIGLALLESMMLAVVGGAAALVLSIWGGAVLRTALLPNVDWTGTGTGWRFGLFVAALALTSGLLAGLLPAAQAGRRVVAGALKSSARGSSAAMSRVRNVLTVGQAALSVLLLVGAGLFVASLQQVRSLDGGMNLQGLMVVRPVFEQGVEAEARGRFREAAAERLRSLPLVAGASLSSENPFFSIRSMPVRVPGRDSLPNLPGGGPYVNAIDAEYLDVMGHRMLRGRTFDESDRIGDEPVVIVSESTARVLWPGENALEKCLFVGDEGSPCRRVAGVVEDFARFNVVREEPAMQLFLPSTQMPANPPGGLVLRLREGVDPAAATALIQRELTAMEPSLRTVDLTLLSTRIESQSRPWQLGATMFSIFGAIALLVAAIGLYSVLAFGVANRTLELGIRAALGANRRRLLALVVREGALLTMLGILIGTTAAVLLAPRMEHLLYEVSPREPMILAGVAGLLLLVGLAAALLPALRATRVDPAVPLRAD